LQPLAPLFHHAPQQVAPDTWLIRQLQGEGTPAPVNVYINSLVIRGAQPVIVDTGTPANRAQWMEDVFSIVEPADVRWIFISHDDVDHTGNLAEVLDACPNATLAFNWFMTERLTCAFDLPLHRMRWVDEGDSIDAGDRTFAVIRPPLYDSPSTRGLYDPVTGVYWASDCFAAPVPQPVEDVAELDAEFWTEGFEQFQRLLSPWHTLVDQSRFDDVVGKVEALGMTTLASAHAPVVPPPFVAEAFRMLRRIPGLPVAEVPGQADLEAMLGAMHPA
jgi:flavorubredoxin